MADVQRSLLSFPNPVNDVAARTVATGVIVLAVLAIALRAPWITILLAYGFVARVASGPRFSPLGQFATRVVAPRLKRFEKLVPGPPKRFAQTMGALFALSALGLWLGGETTAAYVILGILIVPATAEAAFGYCVGCEIFAFGMRLGIVPTSVCANCADLWGEQKTARRPSSPSTAQ
jgi:hypothetical protein